jgi:hypothetical protein
MPPGPTRTSCALATLAETAVNAAIAQSAKRVRFIITPPLDGRQRLLTTGRAVLVSGFFRRFASFE